MPTLTLMKPLKRRIFMECPAQPRLERELVVANRERGKPIKPRRKTDAASDPDDDAPGEKTPTEPETI